MCGITGLVNAPSRDPEALRGFAELMSTALVHRGPDSDGHWVDPPSGVALGFRRLAIVDLSPLGNQPMMSPEGRFVVVFNGEIYNHKDLRLQLESEGVRFRGHSDTEVLTAAFERWGVERSLSQFNGMFAIAAWDRNERRLFVARDRLGIKPLYYYHAHGTFGFASELKSLVRAPGFRREVDPNALSLYLKYLYVPAPKTIFRGVYKLPPGTYLIVDPALEESPTPRPYWSLEMVCREGLSNPFQGTEHEAIEQLEDLLRDSIRLRMQADVPVGALLSGGIDSSTVVGLLQELRDEPARTYSVSFTGTEHDEGHIASEVARHLKSYRHVEISVTGREALDVIPALPDLFDEPLADPSQIPTYLISRTARREVTVALSGDGGDELFGGYNRYRYGDVWIRRAQRMGSQLTRLLAPALSYLSHGVPGAVIEGVSQHLPASAGIRLPTQKLAKLGALLNGRSESEMYRTLLSTRWSRTIENGDDPVVGPRHDMGVLEWMMLTDQLSYLPEDLLAKVDRASMATSLEVRVPILDHRILAFSWRLPSAFKIRDGTTKWILRSILNSRVPRHLFDRPKVGFTVPLNDWLRGPLREWAESSLKDTRGVLTDVVGQRFIDGEWDALVNGHSDSALAIWAAVMFNRWEGRWCGVNAETPILPSVRG